MGNSAAIGASVVVPVYNDVKHIAALVQSLCSQSMPGYEILVVDDQSHDGTWEKLSEFSHEGLIRLFRSPRNSGSGYCRNLGGKQANGQIIAFTDSDCVVDGGWLVQIIKPIVGGKVDASFGPNHLCLRNLRTCRLEAVRAKQYGGMDTKNMAIRRDVFLGLGGFREDIRLNVDAEFHRRFVEAGYRVARTDAIVLHDFPDDAIALILKSRMRGREEARSHSGARNRIAILRFLASRTFQKLRRSRVVWAEGHGTAESMAMIAYYLSFHACWNGALAASLLTRPGSAQAAHAK